MLLLVLNKIDSSKLYWKCDSHTYLSDKLSVVDKKSLPHISTISWKSRLNNFLEVQVDGKGVINYWRFYFIVLA